MKSAKIGAGGRAAQLGADLGARLAIKRRRLGLSLVATAHRLAPEIDSNALARRIQRLEQGKRPDLALATCTRSDPRRFTLPKAASMTDFVVDARCCFHLRGSGRGVATGRDHEGLPAAMRLPGP